MKERFAEIERKTGETQIRALLKLDGVGNHDISTGIPFFDHMLRLFVVHGFFDLKLVAEGDIEVDFHHTVEDVGLVMGDALNKALGSRKGIRRFGFAATPMDDALTSVALDLSKRPFLVYRLPPASQISAGFDRFLSNEFFRAFAVRGGMNLHINGHYGENEHHILESIFKAVGRALDEAVSIDERITDVRSSKGTL